MAAKFSFETWAAAVRPIETAGRQALSALVQADTQHQERMMRQGAETSSNLTDEAQEAAAKIEAHTRRQLAAVHERMLPPMDAEHRRLTEALMAAAERCAAVHTDLVLFESVMESHLRAANLPQRARVVINADLGLHLRDVIERARRIAQPAPAPVAAPVRPLLARPDFSGLLAKIFG